MKIKVYTVIGEEKYRKNGEGKTDGPKLRLIVMDVEAFPLKNISSNLGNDERKWFVGWKLGVGKCAQRDPSIRENGPFLKATP
jgi:hypothetical protein